MLHNVLAEFGETRALGTVKCQPAKRIQIQYGGAHFPKNSHEILKK